jgi:hypothetical protein
MQTKAPSPSRVDGIVLLDGSGAIHATGQWRLFCPRADSHHNHLRTRTHTFSPEVEDPACSRFRSYHSSLDALEARRR